jgi:hypothetical protein
LQNFGHKSVKDSRFISLCEIKLLNNLSANYLSQGGSDLNVMQNIYQIYEGQATKKWVLNVSQQEAKNGTDYDTMTRGLGLAYSRGDDVALETMDRLRRGVDNLKVVDQEFLQTIGTNENGGKAKGYTDADEQGKRTIYFADDLSNGEVFATTFVHESYHAGSQNSATIDAEHLKAVRAQASFAYQLGKEISFDVFLNDMDILGDINAYFRKSSAELDEYILNKYNSEQATWLVKLDGTWIDDGTGRIAFASGYTHTKAGEVGRQEILEDWLGLGKGQLESFMKEMGYVWNDETGWSNAKGKNTFATEDLVKWMNNNNYKSANLDNEYQRGIEYVQWVSTHPKQVYSDTKAKMRDTMMHNYLNMLNAGGFQLLEQVVNGKELYGVACKYFASYNAFLKEGFLPRWDIENMAAYVDSYRINDKSIESMLQDVFPSVSSVVRNEISLPSGMPEVDFLTKLAESNKPFILIFDLAELRNMEKFTGVEHAINYYNGIYTDPYNTTITGKSYNDIKINRYTSSNDSTFEMAILRARIYDYKPLR